jgi:hypothetical protein
MSLTPLLPGRAATEIRHLKQEELAAAPVAV